MDLASLFGVVVGVTLLFWAIFLGGSITAFWNAPSLMITLGGTLAATMIAFPFSHVVSVFRVVKNVFIKQQRSPGEVIDTLVRFAEKARREGLLALEDEAENLDDEFLKKGIHLVVDGTDPDLIRSILDTELTFLEERHKIGQSLFQTMGALAPAFGLTGTLIGLIQMLKNMSRPDMIGPGLAVALITTFYGVVLANLVFLPIAGKLRVRSADEVLMKQVMVEGILSIQAGDNPRIVEEKLKAFLAPRVRHQVSNHRKVAIEE